MRVFFAVGVVVCLLASSHAVPVDQQGNFRNHVPGRYSIRGTLLHNDGTFTRQDPPQAPQSDDQQQSMYDQFGQGQSSNLAYQQQAEYPTQDETSPYTQQSFQNYQPEQQSDFTAGQNNQNAYYNTQQDLPAQQNVQSYAEAAPQNDDLRGQGGAQQMYNTMPQEYQANYNNQVQQVPQFQGVQQAYNTEQPQPSSQDDIQGSERNIIKKKKEEARNKLLGATKKYKIPKNLSLKDLAGLQGYTKQIYLRGGH